MKNKMTLIIITVVIVIFLGSVVYMKMSCTGLWERQVSKIPSNLLSKKEDEPDDYTRCIYVGFSGIIKKISRDSTLSITDSSEGTILNYKNINPGFSFDYPNLEGYEIATGSNYIEYGRQSFESDGPTWAYIKWSQIYIKVTADYWDKQKVNKKGNQYALSEDENTLDFRLYDQGSVIRFDVKLPGGYLRKKQIIDTIIDSFEETVVTE